MKKRIFSILIVVSLISTLTLLPFYSSFAENVISVGSGSTLIHLKDITRSNVNTFSTGDYQFFANTSTVNYPYTSAVINVKETGYYTLGVNILTRDQIYNNWNVYLDDMTKVYDSFKTWLASGWYNNEAVDLYLTEGTHTIKIEATAANAFFNEFTLTKKVNHVKSKWIEGAAATGGTGTISHAKYQISNAGNVQQYAEYTANVNYAGTYRISMQYTWNEADITYASFAVNGTDVANSITLPSTGLRGDYGNEHKFVTLGEVSLKAGANTIKITNKDLPKGQTIKIARIKIERIISPTVITAEGNSKVSFYDAIDGTTTIAENCVKFATGQYATVAVDVKETGYYTMGVNILTRDQMKNIWNVYVDDMTNIYDTFYTWLGSIRYDNEAMDLYLTKGIHFIKIHGGLNNAYFDGFTLTKKANNFKSIWMLGTVATGTGNISNEKYSISNAGVKNQYAEYSVNAPVAGIYRISIQYTWNQSDITSAAVSVNNTEVASAVTLPATVRGVYGDEQKIVTLCESYFNAGENKIKIVNKDYPNGQTILISRIKVDLINVFEVGNGETTIKTADCYQYGIAENYANSGYAGYTTGDYMLCGIDVEESGYYTLDVKARTRNSYRHSWGVYLDDLNTPVESFDIWYNPSTFYDDEVMDVYLEKGLHTLKIVCNATDAVAHFFDELRFTKKEYESKAIWVMAKNSTGTGATAYEKYYINNASNVNNYIEFKVNVPKAGYYNATLQHGWHATDISKYDLIVNGNQIDSSYLGVLRALDIAYRGSTAEAQALSKMAAIPLNAGDNTIKIINKDPDGSLIYISRIKLDIAPVQTVIKNESGDDINLNTALSNGKFNVEFTIAEEAQTADKDLIYAFAVYKNVNGIPEVVASAAKKGAYSDAIVLNFDNFVKETDSTYYAKAFIWDSTTLQYEFANFEF